MTLPAQLLNLHSFSLTLPVSKVPKDSTNPISVNNKDLQTYPDPFFFYVKDKGVGPSDC